MITAKSMPDSSFDNQPVTGGTLKPFLNALSSLRQVEARHRTICVDKPLDQMALCLADIVRAFGPPRQVSGGATVAKSVKQWSANRRVVSDPGKCTSVADRREIGFCEVFSDCAVRIERR